MTFRERIIAAALRETYVEENTYEDVAVAAARTALEVAKEYRMQHHDDCDNQWCAVCGATMGGGHIDSLMDHAKVAKPCSCGLDDLLAFLVGEQP